MASDAKQRLLTAAIEIFARKGYRATTISEVCEAAGANIAAVNYHFNSKENLFRHVLREAFAIADEQFPIAGKLASDAPAEDRLWVFMEALIRRSLDSGPAGHFSRIMSHTGTRKAAPNELVIEEVRRLEGETLNPILAELLGTHDRTRIAQTRLNVIGLCVFPTLISHSRHDLFAGGPTSPWIRTFIDRQVRFALAGLGASRAKPSRKPVGK